jgi:hypothetical protein
MEFDSKRVLIIYGVGYVGTTIMSTINYGSSDFFCAIIKSMTSINSILWPLLLPRICIDLMLLPVFKCLYYNRSLR